MRGWQRPIIAAPSIAPPDTPGGGWEIERLRRQRWTGKQIAAATGVSPATVSRVLRRLGLNKLSALEPAEPVRRYEREHPGELIHLDIKKLGRIGSVGHRITGRYPGAVNRHHGIGWEFVHVCIDDASRIAFVQVLVDQRKESAVAFLEAAVAYFHGVRPSQPPRPQVMHEVSAREGSREAFTGETTGWVSSCETGRIPRWMPPPRTRATDHPKGLRAARGRATVH